MTISSENRKSGPFLGTGAVSEYPFDFSVFAAADLLVVMADANGAESTLVLDSDYTVGLNADQDADPGGSVTLTDPLPADYLLVITSDMEALQPADLTNQGGFYPQVVNASLDRLTILIQQLKEQVSRSLKVSITSTEEATPDALIAEMSAAVGSASAAATAASGSASAAAGSATAASGSASAAATSASAAAASAASILAATISNFRNKVRNGGLNVNQREWAGGSLSNGAFGVDGWRAVNSGVGSASIATTNGKTVITMTSTDFQQRVFGEEIQGDGTATPVPYVLSWEGDAGADIINTSLGTVSATSNPFVVYLTPGVDIDIRMRRSVDPKWFTSVQLERGTLATPFEERPDAIELQICQRHYYREKVAAANKPYSAVCQTLSGSFRALFRCPVKMRSVPTVFEVSGTPGDFQLVHGATAVALTNSLTLSQATDSTVLLDATLAGLTDGRAGYLRNTSANPTYIAWGTGF